MPNLIDFGDIDIEKVKTRADMECATKTHLLNLFKIVLNNNYNVFLIGSRAKGNYTNSSDYDIVIKSNAMNRDIIQKLHDKIDHSFIPFNIDVLNFDKLSDSFKEIAFKTSLKWV